MNIKKIGVLTSGGDAPGMNAAIRAVVRTAIFNNIETVGIMRGYNGLINGDIKNLTLRDVSDIIHRGGTTLFTARCLEFKTEEGLNKVVKNCKDYNIDALVVIGGDGTFRGARDLSARGITCVGIPATIDNDIGCSDYTIGFDTALNTAMEMIDKLRDTAQSHDRCTVVEVMGRRAGYIALETGIACGATFIIVPEIPDIDIDNNIIKKIKEIQKTGKKHFIIVVGEGYKKTNELAEYVQAQTNLETRVAVLGHVQRGGSPSVKDRVTATHMGNYAVNLLINKTSQVNQTQNKSYVVIVKNGEVTSIPIEDAFNKQKEFDYNLYNIASQVSL
ncbi:MAG: 6-phosphofructokinase [Oscillospiraceae bacterium]|nr:6-phosphofructokinase [Oscillospiraceae bacterium]